MGITIFAAKKELPGAELSLPSEITVMGAGSLHGRQQSVPERAHTGRETFSTSAGHFVTLCEILNLPERVNEFDPHGVIQACDAALLNLDNVLCNLNLNVGDREFYFREIMQIRDIAIVGLSQGADRIRAY